jgi:hypothetical protein
MSERIESSEIPQDSTIYFLKRDAQGATSVTTYDPKVFRNISQVIKKALAANPV